RRVARKDGARRWRRPGGAGLDVTAVGGTDLLVPPAQLLVDLHGDGDRLGGHRPNRELTDGLVHPPAGDLLTERASVLRRLALAVIQQRDLAGATPVVSNRHPAAASAAHQHTLQQRRPFTSRRPRRQAAAPAVVRPKEATIALVLLPGDIPRMGTGQPDLPLLRREGAAGHALPLAGAPVEVHPRVPGVLQDAQDTAEGRVHPG